MIYLSLTRRQVVADLVQVSDAKSAVRQLGSRLVSCGFLATTYAAEGSVGVVKVDLHFPDARRTEWQTRRALAAGIVIAWASSAGHELSMPALPSYIPDHGGEITARGWAENTEEK